LRYVCTVSHIKIGDLCFIVMDRCGTYDQQPRGCVEGFGRTRESDNAPKPMAHFLTVTLNIL